MKVKFSKSAIKFLEKLKDKDKERIRANIKFLVSAIEEAGIIPFRELDLKRLEGNWKGFMRIRTGKIRVIFRINKDLEEVFINKQ